MTIHHANSDSTLAAAIKKAKDGDTILLAAGTYKAIPNQLLGKNIHIDGQGKAMFLGDNEENKEKNNG